MANRSLLVTIPLCLVLGVAGLYQAASMWQAAGPEEASQEIARPPESARIQGEGFSFTWPNGFKPVDGGWKGWRSAQKGPVHLALRATTAEVVRPEEFARELAGTGLERLGKYGHLNYYPNDIDFPMRRMQTVGGHAGRLYTAKSKLVRVRLVSLSIDGRKALGGLLIATCYPGQEDQWVITEYPRWLQELQFKVE